MNVMAIVMDTRPAAYAVILERGCILLTHSPRGVSMGRAGWTLPGGGMEPGESPEQTAVREVYEETGYRVRTETLLGADSRYHHESRGRSGRARPFHALRLIYRAHVLSGELGVVLEDDSTDDARWVPLDELGSLRRASLVDVALRLVGLPVPDQGPTTPRARPARRGRRSRAGGRR